MRVHKGVALLVTAAVMVVLAGCGSSGSNSSSLRMPQLGRGSANGRLTARPYPAMMALRIWIGAPMPTSGSNPEPVPWISTVP